MSIEYVDNLKYFKNYDIIYVKQKSKGISVVIGLYPNEIGRERSGARAPLQQFIYRQKRPCSI